MLRTDAGTSASGITERMTFLASSMISTGQIDENQFNTMSENEKALLILQVSTADQFTDISGRVVLGAV